MYCIPRKTTQEIDSKRRPPPPAAPPARTPRPHSPGLPLPRPPFYFVLRLPLVAARDLHALFPSISLTVCSVVFFVLVFLAKLDPVLQFRPDFVQLAGSSHDAAGPASPPLPPPPVFHIPKPPDPNRLRVRQTSTPRRHHSQFLSGPPTPTRFRPAYEPLAVRSSTRQPASLVRCWNAERRGLCGEWDRIPLLDRRSSISREVGLEQKE